MFSEEKPELLGAIGEKVFYKTRVAGSNRRCLRKPELLGAVGGGDVFEKQSTALAAARTINPYNHITSKWAQA